MRHDKFLGFVISYKLMCKTITYIIGDTVYYNKQVVCIRTNNIYPRIIISLFDNVCGVFVNVIILNYHRKFDIHISQ